MILTRHEESIYSVAVSPDGSLVATSSFDKKMRLTETQTSAQLAKYHLGSVFNYSTDFSPDGILVLGGCKTISVWDIKTGKKISHCKGHKHEVNSARFSPSGKKIATGSGENWTPADFSIRIWDTQSGKEEKRVKLESKVESLLWIDEKTILALVGNSVVSIDTQAGQSATLRDISFSSEAMDYCHISRRVIVAKEYGAGALVFPIDATDGSQDLILECPRPKPESGFRFTRTVAARPNGKGFAAGMTYRDYNNPPELCVIMHWDEQGKEISQSEWHGDFLQMIVYAPDGEQIYSGDSNGELRSWNVQDGSPVELAPSAHPPKAKKPSPPKTKAKKNTHPLFLYSDVFGVTALSTGKQLKCKSTQKFASYREITSNQDLKLLLLNGSIQTGAYQQDGIALLNLPGLGQKTSLSMSSEPMALLGGGLPQIAQVSENDLVIYDIDGDQVKEQRRIAFHAHKQYDPCVLGPQPSTPVPSDFTLENMLAVDAGGSFAALSKETLYLGTIALEDDQEDKVSCSIPLSLHPTATKSLGIDATKAWFVAMDHAEKKAHVLLVHQDGKTQQIEFESLSVPALTDSHVLFSPSSHRLTRRNLTDGKEKHYDITKCNEHPSEAPEDAFYKGNVPPPPTRLVSILRAHEGRFYLIPWHRETIVNLESNEITSRDLPAETGPFRRGMMEILARDNEALAKLQVEMFLSSFSTHAKYKQCPMNLSFPKSPPTFSLELAYSAVAIFTERFEMRTHDWGWGTFGRTGGCERTWYGTADVDEVIAALQWMRSADLVPMDVETIHDAYESALGIPHDPNADRLPFTPAAEKIWLKAMLDIIKNEGEWKASMLSTSWKSEPLTQDAIISSLQKLPAWKRNKPYDGIHHLSCVLANHLGQDAISPLLELFGQKEEYNWKHYRDAGELLVWLCHQHPHQKDHVMAEMEAQKSAGHWNEEKKNVYEALGRNARHLWSNG